MRTMTTVDLETQKQANAEIMAEIERLKKERNAVLLVHNYQLPEVQDVADFLGDSLGLSRQAAATDADVIVFCGVHFMAQTAKLLSPDKLVLMPDLHAGCPMADMITAEQLRAFKAEHPGVPVVAYVNTTAEVKAESDICCTSANSVEVVKSLEEDTVIFVPDQYLAQWTQQQVPEKKIIPYPGFCPVHVRIAPDSILAAKQEHPEAVVIVHPECPPDVTQLADLVASTSGMVKFVRQTDAKEVIVGTEVGMIYRLQRENPAITYYPIEVAVCANMKKTTLPKVLESLSNLQYPIEVAPDIADRARRAVERMAQIGR